MLEVKELSKKYGKRYGLIEFNYNFENKVYGLLGPNGAGKSTLMNIICKVLKRTSGEIIYEGKDIDEWKDEYRKYVGYLPQYTGLYQDFTVKETLEYFAYLRGVAKEKVEENVNMVLEYTNLSDRAKDKVESLSGGMKRRLAIAITLVGNPKILIFDEPTASLDPRERYNIKNMILELAKNNKTILFTSHDLEEVEDIASKIVFLYKGEILEKGSKEELLKKYNFDSLEKVYLHITNY